MDDAILAQIHQRFPPAAIQVTKLEGGISMVQFADSCFRDLEVSGGGRAYVIRTDSFSLTSPASDPFTAMI